MTDTAKLARKFAGIKGVEITMGEHKLIGTIVDWRKGYIAVESATGWISYRPLSSVTKITITLD